MLGFAAFVGMADVIAVTVVKGTSVVHSVIPAKAGIQSAIIEVVIVYKESPAGIMSVIPAKAGIQSTIIEVVIVYKESPAGIVICWIPASAGMTVLSSFLILLS